MARSRSSSSPLMTGMSATLTVTRRGGRDGCPRRRIRRTRATCFKTRWTSEGILHQSMYERPGEPCNRVDVCRARALVQPPAPVPCPQAGPILRHRCPGAGKHIAAQLPLDPLRCSRRIVPLRHGQNDSTFSRPCTPVDPASPGRNPRRAVLGCVHALSPGMAPAERLGSWPCSPSSAARYPPQTG